MKQEQKERIVKGIQISAELHSDVKEYAQQNGMTISGLTTRLLIDYLQKRNANNHARCITKNTL